jgi:MFS family permease
MPKFSGRFPALASRDFFIFWVGQFVSLIGTWMQNTTLPYLAYRLTGRPLDLGIVGFSITLPTLLLALPGGVLVEHLDKRRTVIVMQTIEMIQAFVLAFLALTGVIQIWHLILLSFVLGSATTIEITARQAMLIELVGKPALPNAIALQSTIFNAARVLGPSLTAVVLVLAKNQGEGWAFFINGVSFLFVIVGLFFVRTPYKVNAASIENGKRNMMVGQSPTMMAGQSPTMMAGQSPTMMAGQSPTMMAGQSPTMMAEFSEGQRYILGNASVTLIVLMAAVIGFFGFPFGQQIPAVARDVLKQFGDTETIVKARTSALYIAQGVGALVSSLLISAFSDMKRKGLLLAFGQFIFAIVLIGIAFTKSLPLTLVLIMLLGLSIVTQLAMMNTLIQLEVPDALRGRVFSTYLWALQGVAPFGSLFIGWVAQTWNVPLAALICGGMCLLAAILIHSLNPTFRQSVS